MSDNVTVGLGVWSRLHQTLGEYERRIAELEDLLAVAIERAEIAEMNIKGHFERAEKAEARITELEQELNGAFNNAEEFASQLEQAEAERDRAIKDHIRCCETNNENANKRAYAEVENKRLRGLLKRTSNILAVADRDKVADGQRISMLCMDIEQAIQGEAL